MYELRASYIKKDFAWTKTDISSKTLKDLLSYQNARLTIRWDQEGEVDFFLIPNKHLTEGVNQTTTVKNWVESLDKDSLVTTNKARGLVDSNVAQINDLFDYSVKLETANSFYGEGVPIPKGLDHDLRFTNSLPDYDDRSMAKIHQNCLAVVNGLVCPMAKVRNWLYILEGANMIRNSRENNVSLVDFTNLGGIETFNMSEDMLFTAKQSDTDKARMQTRIKVTLPKGIDGYAPILVLDGRLHILDGSYKQISNKEIVITVDHWLALRRSSVKPRLTRNWVSAANLRGAGENVPSFDPAKYLVDTNSFIVLVKTKDLCIQKEPVCHTGVSGVYTHYRSPRGLLFFDDLTLAPYYVSDYNEFEVSLNTLDSYKPGKTYDIVDKTDVTGINETGWNKRYAEYYDAFILDMYSFA